MTRDDILNMPAGFEMDRLVAEKVMGWKRGYISIDPGGDYPVWNINEWKDWRSDAFWPSRDIAAAWEVVDKFRGMDTHWSPSVFWDDDDGLSDGYWNADFRYYGEKDSEFRSDEAIGDTAPLAICRAALLAVMK